MQAVLIFLLIHSISIDEYHLARAIQGERPDLVSSLPDLADRIGYVAINRLEAGWCSSMEQCVREGFWGAESVKWPDEWAVESAKRVWNGGAKHTDLFYVMSLEDTNNLKITEKPLYREVGPHGLGLVFYGRTLKWNTKNE
jgi:hypothetical protein